MKYAFLFCFWAMCTAVNVQAQSPNLLAGPMPAWSEIHEVAIWLQCKDEAEVEIRYYGEGLLDTYRSVTKKSSAHNYNCLTFEITGLEQGARYVYEVYVDEKRQYPDEILTFSTQSLWQYRTEVPEFSLAIGSCTFINDEPNDRAGKPYGGEYGIFDQIAEKKPYAMLWLGDNTYYRVPDLATKSGMYYRQSHTRSTPELQKLLRSTHHYAIWDDHDYGPNDANRSFINKEWALEAFTDFWPRPYATHEDLNGITGQASLFDVDLFFLDNRWNRTDPDLETVEEQVLGKSQLDWFIEALNFSKANFKLVMIGGQVLSDYAAYENYARYEEERNELIRRIEKEGIEGVVFLTGDRHSTELSSIEFKDGRQVLDLTCSPLTSTSYDHSAEPNNNRVKGTHYGDRNFGLLHFEGQYEDRKMRIEIIDNLGMQVWEKTYTLKDLK